MGSPRSRILSKAIINFTWSTKSNSVLNLLQSVWMFWSRLIQLFNDFIRNPRYRMLYFCPSAVLQVQFFVKHRILWQIASFSYLFRTDLSWVMVLISILLCAWDRQEALTLNYKLFNKTLIELQCIEIF